MKKYIVLFVFTFALTSCCGAKEVANSQPEEIVDITSPESPEVQNTPEVIEVQKEEVEELPISTKPEDIETAEAFNHSVFNNLLQKHVSDQGNVNYNGFKKDRAVLKKYIASLGDNMPNNIWTTDDKLAYWINAYNALTIDLILRNPSIKSIKEIDDPWDQKLWKLGSKYYDLNEIEHDILRKMNEPRFHFAIVCASVSCPKLQNQAFSASGLASQLTNATKEFLNDSSKNKLSTNKLELSKIFKWFTKDFKQGLSLIDFLNKYSDIKISQKASISYKDYDWNLNE